MNLRDILIVIILIFVIIIGAIEKNKTLLYAIHTKNKLIFCKYHNSRDVKNGFIYYYDDNTKEKNLLN